MAENTERITIRVPPSTKYSIDKIPEDNSSWIRDILDRELSQRELVKDQKKKEAPMKIERVKELNSEIDTLENQVADNESRLEELQNTLNGLRQDLNQKRSLKQKIIDEIQDETDMDEIMVKGLVGDME